MNIQEKGSEFEVRDRQGRRITGFPERAQAEAFVAGASWCWDNATKRILSMVRADMDDILERGQASVFAP